MFKRFIIHLDKIFSPKVLLKIIALLIILFLLIETDSVWGNWIALIYSIVQPFLVGFILAYVMYPFIKKMIKIGIPKNLAIIILWVLLILAFVLLAVQLLPILFDKMNDFIASIINSITWVGDKVSTYEEVNEILSVRDITDTLVKMLQPYDQWVSNIVTGLPGVMNSFLSFFTNALLSIIIAVYMLFDFPKIKRGIVKFFSIFYKDSAKYLHQIDEDVSVYIRSLLLLMIIMFVEYSSFYFIIGHQDWIIIGLLASIGLLIPYLGGAIANVIGILTALSLPPSRIFILIIGICILTNVDAYVTSPLVHGKRSDLGPLSTLLAVFAGGILLGAIGIMISIPIAIMMKSIHQVYNDIHGNDLEQTIE